MPIWYPSCKIRLLVRFEDFIPSPALPAPLIPGEPEAFGGQTFEFLKFDIVPYSCSITLNSYREADQATVTIPFRALPLDPRVLRAVAIHIYCGSISPADYADGVGPTGGKSRLTLVSDSIDPNQPSSANEVFRGFVDEVEVNQDGDDTITLECRDQTSIFLDAEVGTQGLAGIPRDMPLDQVISQIIIGEGTGQGLVQPAPEKWSAGQRQTIRGKRRRLKSISDANTSKLAKLTAALTDPAWLDRTPEIVAKIAELTAQQATITSALAAASVSEATRNATPILAQRFGLPGARGTLVVNETRFPVMPTLAELKGVKWFDSKGTAKKAPSAGARSRINYWDLITDLCVASGFVCYMRRPTRALPGGVVPAAELVITEPRTYYGDRDIGEGITVLADELPEFVYGYNVTSLVVERNLTGKNAPTHIQVNARTSESGELVTARYPPLGAVDPTGSAPAPANRATPSGVGDRIEVQTMTYKGEIPEARAQEILSLVAEKVYEELSRGEFRVTIKTTDLSFLPSNRGASPPVADIFSMVAGNSLRIAAVPTGDPEITRGLITQAGVFSAMSLPDRIQMLMSLGLSPLAAAQAAEAYENDLFQNVYRVRSVGIQFDHNNGFEFTIEAVNYLDARNALQNVE